MKLFNIILNSKNYFQGNNTANCNYNIDLKQLLDYDEKNYKKKYKLRFQLNSNTLSPSTSNLYGVYLTGLSNNIKNGVINNNTDYYHFLGVLKPKLTKLMYMLEVKYDDNEPVILEGLNHTSNIGVQIKNLTTKNTAYLNNDMIFYFKFNASDINGTALYNHASNQFIGTLNNGSTIDTTQPRLGNGSLNNTATNAYFNIGTNINFTSYPSGLTLSFFYKSSIINTTQTLFVFDGVPIADTSSTHIQITNNNQITYRYFGLNLLVLQTFTYNLCDGKYHHFLLVFGNISTHYLYIDGVLRYTLNNTYNDTTTTTNYIGENSWSTGTGKQSVGYFDDWRLYNRPLSTTEITDLYNSFIDLEAGLVWWFKFKKEDFSGTSLYDYVSKTFKPTVLRNGATYSSNNPKIGNTCLDLNQTTTAYIVLPRFNFSTSYTNTPLTISFWYKPNTNASIYSPYGDYRDGRYFLFGASNLIDFLVDNTPTETSYQFFYNNVAIITATYTGLGDTLNNSWLHLALVFGNTSTFKLYLNGNLITTASNTQTLSSAIDVNFGQNFSQGYLRGYANDMRLYARELTANEVLSLYEIGNVDYEIKLSLEQVD
jgi:hypothetical protein